MDYAAAHDLGTPARSAGRIFGGRIHMTDRTVTHSTFVIERTYKVPPAKVFAAFATAEAKSHWFGAEDEATPSKVKLDFRVGGLETNTGGPPGGPAYKHEDTN